MTGQVLPTSSFTRTVLPLTTAAAWRNSLGVPQVGSIEATGLTAGGSTDNRATLQTQWDAAATAGKALSITVPGTYSLTATGSGSSRWCLKPASASTYYGLILGPGVILQLAASQASDGNPVSMIRVADHTGGGFIGWPYGGRGGSLVGNTANQSGWTTASGEGGTRYGQSNGNHGISGTDTSGQGSRNWTIQGLSVTDWFSNPINWGSVNNYDLGSRNIHVDNCYFSDVGEGCQFIGVQNCSMTRIEDVGQAGKRVGDYCELAFCTNFFVDHIYAHTNGATVTTGGAAVDAYASRRGTISNVLAYKTAQGVTLQTDFGNSSNVSTDVVVTNLVCRDVYNQSIIPAEGGSSTFNNILIDNSSLGVSYSIDCSGFATTAQFSLSNCLVTNSYGAGLSKGRHDWSNVSFVGGSNTTSVSAITVGGANSPSLNFNGVKAASYSYGLYMETATPAGRWSGVDLSGNSAGPKAIASGTLADVSIPDGVVGDSFAPYYLGVTGQTDTKPTQGYRQFYGITNSPIKNIAAGHKNQVITIVFLYSGGTLQDYRAGGTSGGNLRLAGGADKAFSTGDSVTLRWDSTQLSQWVEVCRSVN